MRPNNAAVLTRPHQMPVTRRRKMSFNAEAMDLLMENFIDMYADAELAVLREYPSNAWDSHVEAGNTDPIRVYLPNGFNGEFRVVDNGLGMSADDIELFFGDYGNSTKRHTDDLAGMLGLGSKSGLTLVDQFIVIGIKDGVRSEAIVLRAGEDGVGEVKFSPGSITPTDEPNGVTIKIAVRNPSSFNAKADKFYRFWKPGTILVNDEQPKPYDGLQVTDDILVSKELHNDYVVMGNIAYDVGNSLSTGMGYGWHTVANIEMGSVNFTPNRERLRDTSLTLNTIKTINERRTAGINAAIQSAVNDASNKTEAITIAHEWRRLVSGTQLTYKGLALPDTITNKDGGWSYDLRASRYAVSIFHTAYIDSAISSLIVTGFTPEQVTSTHRRKVRQYIEDKNIQGVRHVYFVDTMFGDGWLDGRPRVDYNTIKAIKLPRASGTGSSNRKRPAQKYRVWRKGTLEILDSVPGDEILVFSSAGDQFDGEIISLAFPNSTVVDLSRNRHDKFLRENSKSRAFEGAVRDAFDVTKASLNDAMRLAKGNSSYRLRYLRILDPDRVDDPELARFVRSFKNPPSKEEIEQFDRIKLLKQRVDGYYSTDMDYTVKGEEVLDKYPFLQYADKGAAEHTIEYVNHFYALRADKDN